MTTRAQNAPMAASRQGNGSSVHDGFTLVEMLLAVFILGIGVISIAALFPSGIALQRQAVDDTLGPVVAKNAFATLRSKLSQEDFGSFQDFRGFGISPNIPVFPTYVASQGPAGTIRPAGGNADIPMVSGDWGWMRPAFYTNSTAGEPNLGMIDVFSSNYTRTQQPFSSFLAPRLTPPGPWATEMPSGVDFSGETLPLYGIPYSRLKYTLFDIALSDPNALGAVPLNNLNVQALLEPVVTFSQAERSFPQGGTVPGRPSYYWDCMFRRYGGRIQVAVFVYRVSAPGGDLASFKVRALANSQITGAPAPPTGAFFATAQTPPIPALYLAPAAANGVIPWPLRGTPTGTFTAANGYTVVTGQPAPADEIFGTHRGTAFAPLLIWDDWQLPNSWWVDNHGTVHKVFVGRTAQGSSSTTAPNAPGQGPVKLQRPIPDLPKIPLNGVVPGQTYQFGEPSRFISGIWYVPQRDSQGNIITPVFAAVEEL